VAARGSASGRPLVAFSAALGDPARPLGRMVLIGTRGPGGLARHTVPGSVPRELGLAMEQVWRLHRRTRRLTVINDVMAIVAAPAPVEQVYRSVADAVGRLVPFDALNLCLVDGERGEMRTLDVAVRTDVVEVYDMQMAPGGTLFEWVAHHGVPRRVNDATTEPLPEVSRELLARRGFRSAVLVPMVAQGRVIGTLNVLGRAPDAFSDEDVEVLTEVAQPLASAIEHVRLHAEIVRRADELAALNRTSQLITARLDLASLLDAIARSVTGLMGSTGCGIGLLNADRSVIEHAAAHGFRTIEWRSLAVAVGEGIIGRAVSSGQPVRSDDLRMDPRSARQDIDEKEGIRSMLSVPLRAGDEIIGVISAFSTAAGFFNARRQTLLEAFADQAGIAIQNARLFAESQRRARETQALLEAGRAVNQSLEVGETIHVILQQAREVLGVASCSLFTLDPQTGELAAAASLDMDEATRARIRIRVGEGITGAAVEERRPVQSPDLFSDPRVRFRQAPAASALRSMLAVPLLVGDQVIGAITALRHDVHRFTPEEESLLSAFADQAATALDRARLFSSVRTYSGQLEAMVAARTGELDEQKRFVEVVLETLPLGLFVLDAALTVVSANREGHGLLPRAGVAGRAFADLLPPGLAAPVRGFLERVIGARAVRQTEQDWPDGAELRTFRISAAPLRGTDGLPTHVIVLVEDVTIPKRLERQMILNERLTTAGRLASGVAHELNNPLATIAGCAEALRERAQDPGLLDAEAFKDFPGYLRLIEEEAYRCKEITGSLLQFVRDPGSRRLPADVNALVDKALELLSHQPRFASSQLLTALDPGLPAVVANEGQLRQVFIGLASNALEAMEGRGVLTVTTRRHGEAEIEVSFADQGPGIPEDILARVFDPFFTTKPPGQGTGLGLAIAQGFVAEHGGRIEVTSVPGAGSTFRVLLPSAPPDGGASP
jgi:GAF domain-containing protein/nitrogen-specific signal transduction histidine kinase